MRNRENEEVENRENKENEEVENEENEEVRNERESFFVDCIEAVSRGDMDDFDPADHRIEKIIEAHDPIES